MAVTTKSLYDTDFVEWAKDAAESLRQRRFDDLDLDNLVEEINALGGSQKSAVLSQLARLLMHLMKYRIQPDKATRSWRHSIADSRSRIEVRLKLSPSLRPFLRDELQWAYALAIKQALDETGLRNKLRTLPIPTTCPYSLEDLLDVDIDKLIGPSSDSQLQ